MQDIELSTRQKSDLVEKIKTYFQKNLDQDIGQFEAEFLLDFFAKEIGVYFYNQGVRDANTLLSEKFNDLQHALYEIEQAEPY